MAGIFSTLATDAIGRNITAGGIGRVVGGMSVPCEEQHF